MSRGNIKIVLLVKSIDGGTGSFVLDLLDLKKIVGKNTQIQIVVLEKPSFRKIINKDIIFINPQKFYPQKYFLSFRNIFNFFYEILILRSKLSKIEPDVILSIDLHCNILSYFEKVLLLNKFKIIFSFHINLMETIKNKSVFPVNLILSLLVRFTYNRADALVSVSKELAVEIKRDFNIRKKINTIYIGIDTKGRIKNTKGKIIFSAGRFVEQKDFFTLIDAFKILSEKLPQYKLLVAGDGPQKKELQEYSKGNQKIKFLGWKQNLSTIFKSSSLFILSSRREGLPYVLLEAMSYGLPIISTDAAYGPSEIIGKNEFGLLVPIGNKEEMKNAMNTILKTKNQKFYSKKSLERSKSFSKENMLNEYSKLINRLI